jgi:hypothetical protein
MTTAHRLTLASVAVLAVLALTSAPALANSSRTFSHTIGSGPGEGAGELSLVAPRLEFTTRGGGPSEEYKGRSSGVAVDALTHDVYVADTGSNRVDEFEAGGAFVRAWGWGVADGAAELQTCGPDAFPATIICQKGLSGSGMGELNAPSVIAVDNSGGASEGDVYVGAGQGVEATNEEQWIEIVGATGGTFKLVFEDPKGETAETEAIEYVPGSVGGEELEGKVLIALSKAVESIDPGGSVQVIYPIPSNGLRVLFGGNLKETDIPKLKAKTEGLAGTGAEAKVYVSIEGAHFVPEAIDKFNANGELVKGWGDHENGKGESEPDGELDGVLAEHGPFEPADGVAVDAGGRLWVDAGAHAFKFSEAGAPVETVPAAAGYPHGLGVALDSADDLYSISNSGESNVGCDDSPVASVSGSFFSGVAVDAPAGEVFVDTSGSSIERLPASCSSIEEERLGEAQLKAGGGAGLAVDSSVETAASSGAVYVADTSTDQLDVFGVTLDVFSDQASEVNATAVRLNGEVNPVGSAVSECYFEYATSGEYSEGDTYGQSAPCEPDAEGIGSGTSRVAVHANVKGLLGGTAYHFRLVVKKGETTVPGDDGQFTTSTVPVVAGAEAVGLTLASLEAGVSGELRATVNPEGLQVERCRFEYGPSAAYGEAVNCEPSANVVGSGSEPVAVSAHLSGLAPNTTYHWRLYVKDRDGEALETDHTLVYPMTSVELPDRRAYEMVTPPRKNGALIDDVFGGAPLDIARSGQRLIAPSIQCFDESPACTGARQVTGDPSEFTRSDEAGQCEPQAPPCWVTTPPAPPATLFSENTYRAWSAEAGTALFSVPIAAGEDEWLTRSVAGSFQRIGPRIDTTVENRETETATADLSRVVWENDHNETGETTHAIYEIYTGGGDTQPFRVDVDDEGKPLGCEAHLGAGTSNVWNAVSADGRTVYFSCGSALFARVDGETPAARTVQIAPGAGRFEGASEDGSRVFFIEGGALYESECPRSTGGKACAESSAAEEQERRKSIDVSAAQGAGPVPGGPRVQGVVATSADGSHVYFVAQGVLTKMANRQGQSAHPGHENLYLYERDAQYPEGRLAFIASLPGSDHPNWEPQEHQADVTPDGRFLVLSSHGDLTPGDHAGGAQIFRYDAQTEQLLRISIGADGYDDDGNAGSGEAWIARGFDGDGADAGPARGDPTMSDDGARIFFTSPVALTPHALDDVPSGSGQYAQNVYEWEQEGAGTCPEGQSAGCVYLISAPDTASAVISACRSGSAVCLLGTDATGNDVFFTTADRLVPKDTDTQVDIYDARVCEPEHGNPCITEPLPALPPCDGENCHGIPEPTPSLLAPGTASFDGEGNVAGGSSSAPPPKKVTKKTTKCKHGFVRKKIKKKEQCVKVKSDKRAKKSAHTNRRAHR